MSSKNDENTGLAIAIAVFGFIGLFVFAVLAFVAAILTILAILAWNKPLKISKDCIVTPEEAREFIFHGLAGAVLVPSFTVFVAFYFGANIDGHWWFYLITGGYVLGALLPAFAELQEERERQAREEAGRLLEMHRQTMTAQPQKSLPRPPAEPFRFASWDEDEERGQ